MKEKINGENVYDNIPPQEIVYSIPLVRDATPEATRAAVARKHLEDLDEGPSWWERNFGD